MIDEIPPYVSTFVSQHGVDRMRFRRKGFPSYYFVNRYGTAAWEREYAACMRGDPLIKISPSQKKVRLKARAQGFVYFIGGRSGPIKIGYSIDARKRLSKISVGSSQHLSLLAKVPGTMDDERRMHHRFAHIRVKGEWFRREPELIAEIERIKKLNVSVEKK